MKMKKFRVGDIFSQERGKEKAPNQVAPGNIPMINETSENNGFTKLCSPSKVIEGNCLTVSINYATTVFYQDKDFAASVNIAILRNDNFNEKSYLYVATLLRRAHQIYDYNHKISKDRLNDEIIYLPVKNTFTPDYNLIENLIGGGIDMSKIDTSTWKEFPLEELFEVTTTKSQNRNAIAFDDDGIYDFIGRSSVNYGIQGHLNRQEYDPNPASVFSLVQVGESVCLYRENEWYASQNVFMLKPKDERICVAHSFFEALINKQLSVYKTAYEYPCLDDVKKMKILLPYKETEEIDFEYMENYISELEAERISELEAFLAVTGLDDYELTEEDKKVLSLSRNARFEENGSVQDVIKDKIKFGEFQIGKLFKKLPLKNKPNFNKKVDISLEKTTTFDLPLVNAKNGNNGIMYYGNSSEYESDVMTIGIVNDGAVSTGNVNPHPEATGVLYNAYLIKPYYEHLNREILEYLSCALEKCIKKRFGYDNKATWEKVNELYVSLPITYNGDPNYDYMEKYIRAIEKQTIAKIYEGRGKVIEKTKEIVFAD